MFHAWRSHIGIVHMAVDKIKSKKKASTSSGGTAIQRAASSSTTQAYTGAKAKETPKVVTADVKVSADESAKIAKEAEIKRAAQAAKDKASKKSAADIFMRNTR